VVVSDDLFGQVLQYPDPDAQERFASLVGIDDIKRRVVADAVLLIDPSRLEQWSERHHEAVIRAAVEVTRRTPLIVFAGDVGTGKTELAETFADSVARDLHVSLTLYPLSLSARGKGAVGEMTTLLTAAFTEVRNAASTARDAVGRVRHGVILLIDEADAIAQSRELAQMHHEDRAGVNALVRGIDQLRNDKLPVLTVLCTNRLSALDPAVTRRAAGVLSFTRPSEEQRRELLRILLAESAVFPEDLERLVEMTGPINGRTYGCTYSDIRQRLVPDAVIDALDRDVPLAGDRLIEIARTFEPTRPFSEE
jgi:AAA+ superfamily predicted ATPase